MSGISESENEPNLNTVLDELRARVAEKQAAGIYPDGLDDRLNHHYQRLADRSAKMPSPYLQARLEDLRWAGEQITPGILETSSEIPGGTKVHAALLKLTGRYFQALISQLAAYQKTVSAAAESMASEIAARDHDSLWEQASALWDRLGQIERGEVGGDGRVAGLEARVAELEARLAALDGDAAS